MNFTNYHPEYFTATVLELKQLLKPDKNKDIIVESVAYLVREKRVEINAFALAYAAMLKSIDIHL